MPVVLRKNGVKYFFFANESNEPPHIHVEASGKAAKFWLNPVSLCKNYGFNAKEINAISQIISENKDLLRKSWDEFFSK